MLNVDSLTVHALELWVNLGCSNEERAFPQRVNMDIQLISPLRKAGKSDRLNDAVDYAEVCRKVRAALENRSFRLLEAVAEAAAEASLSFKKVRAVRIRAEKRALPGIDKASVEITRAR